MRKSRVQVVVQACRVLRKDRQLSIGIVGALVIRSTALKVSAQVFPVFITAFSTRLRRLLASVVTGFSTLPTDRITITTIYLSSSNIRAVAR